MDAQFSSLYTTGRPSLNQLRRPPSMWTIVLYPSNDSRYAAINDLLPTPLIQSNHRLSSGMQTFTGLKLNKVSHMETSPRLLTFRKVSSGLDSATRLASNNCFGAFIQLGIHLCKKKNTPNVRGHFTVLHTPLCASLVETIMLHDCFYHKYW